MGYVADDRPDPSGDLTDLDELIARYLSPTVPVHRQDSTAEVVIDGRDWMLRMRELIGSAVAGDAVYIERAPVINRTLNKDLQNRIIEPLPPHVRRAVGLWRVDHLTVHTKLVLVDDVFASVGSANFFSRSMAGVDTELNVAIVTTGTAVRDLRVRLWAEHLRTPLTDPALRASLEDLDLAIGAFRPEWLPADAPAGMWRRPGMPAGFNPHETVLTLVSPP
jgi:phosphatidylserine/phosphatidylglycerophosphate/cardiolipin synthase-like enzyme